MSRRYSLNGSAGLRDWHAIGWRSCLAGEKHEGEENDNTQVQRKNITFRSQAYVQLWILAAVSVVTERLLRAKLMVQKRDDCFALFLLIIMCVDFESVPHRPDGNEMDHHRRVVLSHMIPECVND